MQDEYWVQSNLRLSEHLSFNKIASAAKWFLQAAKNRNDMMRVGKMILTSYKNDGSAAKWVLLLQCHETVCTSKKTLQAEPTDFYSWKKTVGSVANCLVKAAKYVGSKPESTVTWPCWVQYVYF